MVFQHPMYRNFKRFREILRVINKYGFSLRRLVFFERWAFPPVSKQIMINPPQVNLRMALEELGTTFIKIGQILSTRIDLISEDYCRELKKLQDETTPVDFEEIKIVIEQELKTKIEEDKKTFGLGEGMPEATTADFLKELSALISPSLEIVFSALTYENRVISVKGEAKTVDDVTLIKDALAKSKSFKEVTMGPTSLTRDGGKVDFSLRIEVQ